MNNTPQLIPEPPSPDLRCANHDPHALDPQEPLKSVGQGRIFVVTGVMGSLGHSEVLSDMCCELVFWGFLFFY